MIRVRVLFFGPSRDAAGAESAALELADGATIVELATRLAELYPLLGKGVSSVRFAVDEAFAGEDHVLSDGDEVAVIPPVSGGGRDADLVELSPEPLDMDRVRAHLELAAPDLCGGVCVFEGRTRCEQNVDGVSLLALEYVAYDGMAIRKMQELAGEARARWPVGAMALVHRTGVTTVGEPSVIIAVTGAHREEAFEACRWLIDELKREVPIWKKEIWSNGKGTWSKPVPRGPGP